MKHYNKEIALGTVLALIFAGSIFWFAVHEPGAYLISIIASVTILVGITTFVWKLIAKKRDIATGAPEEDEFTKLAKVYAGSKAFFGSLYLWFLIFVFQASFPNQRGMLGFGILGSILIYGIFLWYFKTTGQFDEK